MNKVALSLELEAAETELSQALIDFSIPSHLHYGIKEYILRGRAAGHFLNAVFRSDLFGAFAAGDETSLEALHDIVKFLYNIAPSSSVGTKERFESWIERGGYAGVLNEYQKLSNEIPRWYNNETS